MLSMSCTQSLSCQRERSIYILLEGDQLTYVQSIKKEYGNDLERLLPKPLDIFSCTEKISRGFTQNLLRCWTTQLGEVQWIPIKFSRI